MKIDGGVSVEELITIRDMCKIYNPGENEVRALDHVNLTIHKNEFVAIIGQSGSGKSTLMNSIAGVLSIDEGDILLEGQSIKKASVDERSKDISRVFQDPRMGTATNLSIEENMAIAYRRGKKRSFFKKSIT